MLTFLESAWLTTVELAPWLLLGALVAGVLHVLLPRDFIRRQLSGRWSVLKSVALGVPLPLCSCGVIPVAISLREQKASRGATVGFLIATPQTGVDSILVSQAMLGWPFAVFKVIAALITGAIGGWITDAVEPPADALPVAGAAPPDNAPRRSWRELFDHAIEILHSIWGWLVVGVLLSAAITSLVPESALMGLAAYGGLAAMAVALVVSLPLYVCATASVPIAAALVAGGLPTGAALVFLMAGPATNAATIGAVRKTIGGRALAVYLTTIIVGSMGAGLLFDYVVASAASDIHTHEHPSTWWGIASAVALLLLIGWFALNDVLQKLQRGKPIAKQGEHTVALAVEGMTCKGCVQGLKTALERDPNIHAARVTLDPPQAEVVGGASPNEVRRIVEQAGYRVKGE